MPADDQHAAEGDGALGPGRPVRIQDAAIAQLDVGADWEECRGDRLGIFGSDLTRILINAPMGQIDVLGGTSPRTMKLAFSRNDPSTGTMRSQAIVFA